jgi:hypothetical protein
LNIGLGEREREKERKRWVSFGFGLVFDFFLGEKIGWERREEESCGQRREQAF